MSNTIKTRQAPRVWKSFFSLAKGESFTVGRSTYVKVGFFTANRASRTTGSFRPQFIYPWVKVRTQLLVRDARAGGSCSNGSCYKPTSYSHPQTEQPHNDNAITGSSS